MKTLYISDLDGTLLNKNDVVSDYSLDILNRLIDDGMIFTYATARSYNSSSIVTKGLNIEIPVVIYNGAFIFDAKSKTVVHKESFSGDCIETLISITEKYSLNPLVYSIVDNIEKVSYIDGDKHPGVAYYLSNRKNDKRMTPLKSKDKLFAGDVFYYTCIGEKDELLPVYNELKGNKNFNCILQQEIYRQEYWCEIMPKKATKANAVLKLKEILNCEKVVSFGDALNDIPMFKISDECYSAANGAKELKAVATGVIDSNENDGVAKKLLDLYY